MEDNFIKIFDMFCSNGSTWYDKKYFKSNNVIKNDIRAGEYWIEHQKINIIRDTNYDGFDTNCFDISTDLVYLDPPHLKFGSIGIMSKKYSTLPEHYDIALKNMFFKAAKIAPITILKWNTVFVPIKEVLEYAKPYFIIAFGNRNINKNNDSFYITLLSKRNQNI